MKIKLFVGKDERWPDYDLYEEDNGYSDGFIKVDEKFFKRYLKAEEEYDKIQEEIGDLLDE